MSDTSVNIPNQKYIESRTSGSKSSGVCVCLGGSSLVIIVLGLSAWSMYIFISTIIMLAEGGWTEIASSCSTSLRDTILAFIILMWVLGGSGGKMMLSSETVIAGGVIFILAFGTLASVLTGNWAKRSDTCSAYLDAHSNGANTANVILINQIAFGWIMTFIGFVGVFMGVACSD